MSVKEMATKISHKDWYELVCKSLTIKDTISPFGDVLPGFPSEELQRNTTSLWGKQVNRPGFPGGSNL